MSIIFSIATDIYRIYVDEQDKTYNPKHLPKSALILFQRFKKAYENKNIIELKDSISDDFCGDIYGTNKKDFIDFMQYNFQRLRYGLSPHLVIEIHNIATSSSTNFSAVINMKANLKFIGIPTSMTWDVGKIVCEARSEGEYNYWRITKLLKF
jgi:hypothetical protein